MGALTSMRLPAPALEPGHRYLHDAISVARFLEHDVRGLRLSRNRSDPLDALAVRLHQGRVIDVGANPVRHGGVLPAPRPPASN